MINHARTLLLNESHTADGAPEWCVDRRFSKLPLKSSLASSYGILFDGTSTVAEKAARVNEIVPFVFAPEFSSFVSGIDDRVTVPTYPEVSSHSVAEFYSSISAVSSPFVQETLSSSSTPLLFQHTGDVDTDALLDSLYVIYSGCKETSKRFSSVVVAVVLLLDLEYRKTQG